MSDPALHRVSDAERQQVAEVLRTAAGEGRLDLDELEERLEATWTAKTYADLAPVLVDLPEQPPAPPGAAVARPGDRSPQTRDPAAVEHGSSLGILSEQKRTGVWRVPGTHTATAVLGAVTIDLRDAVFTERETVVQVNAVLGSVEVYVDAETAVVVDGTPVLGDVSGVKDKVPADLHDGSPVVRVKGLAMLGSVMVIRDAPPGERKRKGWRWH